jgi:hypothetical protein
MDREEREEPTNPSGRRGRRAADSADPPSRTSTLFEVRGRTRVVVLVALVVLGVLAYRLASSLIGGH